MVIEGVAAIPPRAFHRCFNITTVISANTVTRIENGSFFGCKLSYVKLSINTEFIGNLAFASNSNLRSIFIPPRCRWIGEFAFTYCTELSIFHVSRTTEMEGFVLAHCPVLKSAPFQHSSLNILYNDEEEQNNITGLKTLIATRSMAFIELALAINLSWRSFLVLLKPMALELSN